MDPADNRFIHSLAFPFNVKGNAMSITWSLDTPGDWKRLTIDVIFEMYKGLTTPGPLSSLTLVSSTTNCPHLVQEDLQTKSFQYDMKEMDLSWQMAMLDFEGKVDEEEPKVVRKYDDAPSIEEWVLDDEEEDMQLLKIDLKDPGVIKVMLKAHDKELVKPLEYFNSRTRIVEENLHIRFSESTPNAIGTKASTRFLLDDGNQTFSDDGKKVVEDTRKIVNVRSGGDRLMLTALSMLIMFGSTVNDAAPNEVNAVGSMLVKQAYAMEELLHARYNVYQMDVKTYFFSNGMIEEEAGTHMSTTGFDRSRLSDRRGNLNRTLFIKRNKGDILLVQVYVDDIIFGSTNKEICIAFKKLMHEKFQMSSMGELIFFLGLQVKQKKDGIFINGEEVDVHMYRSMIGSLMYLTSSRPDIMFAVCACARYQVNPKVSHLHAVKRIFRYLKDQPKLGLWYPKYSPFDLVAYTDSDYARSSLDMKSTTGGCQFLGCRLISWQCKKQTVVANSITEAEYVAASSCCGQVVVMGAKRIHEDTIVQTRFENVSKHSNDSLLARGNTLQSDEDRLKLDELMALCTTLQNRVLDLEQTKTTQHNEIASLKRRVKKLEKKNRLKTHKLKRLYKVGLTARVETSNDEETLGGDASKQGRIDAINADEEITWKLEGGLNNIWVKEEENMRRMMMMKKIDGLNNEKGKRKWQSMVLEMKIEEIVCSKKEVPARNEVKDVEERRGFDAEEHVGFTSRQEIFFDINGTYNVLTNKKMCHFKIRTKFFHEEFAWIFKYKLETIQTFLCYIVCD
ncbi:putative ribonuclease H-like domain-containing protein [Tanacetum coccineum]